VDAVAGRLPPSPPASVSPPPRVVRGRYRDRDFALRRWLMLADIAGIVLATGLAMQVAGNRENPLGEWWWVLPTLPLWVALFWTYRLYGRPIRSFEPTHLDDLPTLFHALVIGTLVFWLYFKLVPPVPKLNLAEILVFAVAALPLIAMLRAALRAKNLRAKGPERVFAIAPLEDVMLLRRKFGNHPEYEMALVGAATCGNGAEELGLELGGIQEDVDALLASGQVDHLVVRLDADYIPQERVQELMRACHRAGVRFGCFPGVKTLVFPGMELNHVEGMGILTSNPPVLPPSAKLAKRVLDVVVAGIALTLLAPFFALIALAIKLTSEGPVLYRQTRVGRNDSRFKLLKFRTMVHGADDQVEALMKESLDPDWLILDRDPRVTGVGRFLRRNSIDELPQLWNVLKGDMSLVGPRPLPERDDAAVRDWKRHRLDLIPGVTGSWQVLGRNKIPFQEMLEIDYAYVASWSLWLDVKLLLQTVPAVIRRRGAN
jgi:exopolysaccharide biosynthesis polyprenyl glycosylphosphotransferase